MLRLRARTHTPTPTGTLASALMMRLFRLLELTVAGCCDSPVAAVVTAAVALVTLARECGPASQVAGVVFLLGAALLATFLAGFVSHVSPLLIAMLLGIAWGNVIQPKWPLAQTWLSAGLAFTKKNLLKAGIVLYGTQISAQKIVALGPSGVFVDGIMMTAHALFSYNMGRSVLKMDFVTTMLICTGTV